MNVVAPKRNNFDLSYSTIFTTQFGWFMPVMCKEGLPGDFWKINPQIFLRWLPLTNPIMSRSDATVACFYVPYRLIWRDYEDFYVHKGGNGAVQPIMPTVVMAKAFEEGKTYRGKGVLADMLGLPKRQVLDGKGLHVDVSTLPFRGYQLIYNEYYRDQNLQAEVNVSDLSGHDVDDENTFSIHYVDWRHDRFTSALPWPQRGESVKVPLASDIEISNLMLRNDEGAVRGLTYFGDDGKLRAASQFAGLTAAHVLTSNARTGLNFSLEKPTQINNYHASFENTNVDKSPNQSYVNVYGSYQPQFIYDGSEPPTPYLVNSLSGQVDIGSTDVDALRMAFALQRYFEMSALYGERYRERILAEFGVRSQDARVDIPEYIGGYSFPVQISETVQTSASSDISPQGTPSGNAYVVGSTHFKYNVKEAGLLYMFLYIRPRAQYFQGINRLFLKRDNFDFYTPSLAHIGMQGVLDNEIYAQDGQEDSIFGYQNRYDEYRHFNDEVHGDFVRDGLIDWHTGRLFGEKPKLNSEFLQCVVDERIYPVIESEYNHILGQIYYSIKCKRPVARFGNPI